MEALVLGGTGFIGRRLVKHLLEADCNVTIATSGKTPNYFGDRVSTLTFNRFDSESMKVSVSKDAYFDILFDQIGFGPDDVSKMVVAFDGKIGRYIFTSSSAVYLISRANIVEDDYDPASMEPRAGGIEELGYSEGKRSAEAWLFRNARFPFTIARFPIVMGADDATGRTQFHVNRIIDGQEIVIPSPCGKQNYVWVDDAGRFLSWLGLNHKTGVYNAASSYMIAANKMVEEMGRILGRTVKIVKEGEKSGMSPYYTKSDEGINSAKAEREGFHFTPFEQWFQDVVKEIAATGGKTLNSTEYIRKRMRRSA